MKAPARRQGRRKAPPRSAPPPSSLISFTEPEPTGDDHVVRVVFDDREDWVLPAKRQTSHGVGDSTRRMRKPVMKCPMM